MALICRPRGWRIALLSAREIRARLFSLPGSSTTPAARLTTQLPSQDRGCRLRSVHGDEVHLQLLSEISPKSPLSLRPQTPDKRGNVMSPRPYWCWFVDGAILRMMLRSTAHRVPGRTRELRRITPQTVSLGAQRPERSKSGAARFPVETSAATLWWAASSRSVSGCA
jgi:hypothetical protein